MKTARDLLLGDPIYIVHIIGDKFNVCEKTTIMCIRHKRNHRLRIMTNDGYNDVVFDNATEYSVLITTCSFYIRAFSLDIIYDKYSTWAGKILSLNEFKEQLLQKLESNLNLRITGLNSLQTSTDIPVSGGITAQINEYCTISANSNNLI